MIYNILLVLLVIGCMALFVYKAYLLSNEKEQPCQDYLTSDEVEKLIISILSKEKVYDRELNIEDVINIDSHPSFNKKRA